MVVHLRRRWSTVASTRHDLDLEDADSVQRRVDEIQPAAIINCAGYNHVDRAEDEPEAAMAANAQAVLTLARAANDAGATLVHYSTDFVFDGETDRPYREDDRPCPRSVYAASKLMGEWYAADARAHYVLRVESLFGGVGPLKSSLDRIIESVTAMAATRVFVDRVVSPSYAWDVAEATCAVLAKRPAAGIYHCVNTGSASWHDVAVEVAKQSEVPAALEPVRMTDVPLKAARPRYCALSNDKLRATGIPMPTWQEAVGRALVERRTKDEERRTK
jgi:dTDP-4-dehydrorhamnose reductase